MTMRWPYQFSLIEFFCIDSRCHTALAVQSTAGSHPTSAVESSTFDAGWPSRRRNSCFTAYVKGRSLGRSCSCYTRRTWYSWLSTTTWAYIYTQMIPRSMVRVGRQRPHSCSIVCRNAWLTLPLGCAPIGCKCNRTPLKRKSSYAHRLGVSARFHKVGW